ncbi:MAG: dihydroorotate dehydrogenase-like protein [Verrucomicrobiota bacterium]
MNLSTDYLGLKLRTPFVIGASPFCESTAVARQLQDGGAGALVMRSLFEEQIDAESRALVHHLETPADSNPEALSYFPQFSEYLLSPERYLSQIADLKRALTIPVIASLNGTRPGGWTDYARRFEQAGADAIELNLYQLVTDAATTADSVESEMVETVRQVVRSVQVPVAVKISPFHTSPAQFVTALEGAGAKGVVLFNRFYQPDFNIEEMVVSPQLALSDRSELLLRLRWLAIISPQMRGSLAATGGVHTTTDVVKALLAGAHTVQLVSVLLRHGPRFLTTLVNGLQDWLREHEYESLDQLRGAMSHRRCPDPAAFERANYIRILQSWRV